MNRKLAGELLDAVKALEADSGIGCLVITGAGDKAFTAGGDIKEQVSDDKRYSREEQDTMAVPRRLLDISMCAKPVIGMMNGLAYGGAAVLASSIDFRIGCERTKFRFLAAAYGRINSTWSLGSQIGWPQAKELLFTARIVEAEEAYRIGLLNHLVPSGRVAGQDDGDRADDRRQPSRRGQRRQALLLEQQGESLEARWAAEHRYSTAGHARRASQGRFPRFPDAQGHFGDVEWQLGLLTAGY